MQSGPQYHLWAWLLCQHKNDLVRGQRLLQRAELIWSVFNQKLRMMHSSVILPPCLETIPGLVSTRMRTTLWGGREAQKHLSSPGIQMTTLMKDVLYSTKLADTQRTNSPFSAVTATCCWWKKTSRGRKHSSGVTARTPNSNAALAQTLQISSRPYMERPPPPSWHLAVGETKSQTGMPQCPTWTHLLSGGAAFGQLCLL